MNLLSFVDELVKVGAVRPMYKRAMGGLESEPPAGMMDSGPVPPVKRLVPAEASTRIETAHLPVAIKPGSFGRVEGARHPIDQERFNRPFKDKR